MLEAVDNNNDDSDNHDVVVGQKRLGSVKARNTPAVVTSATTSEASDVRRTLRIGRVIVAKRAATTTTTSSDDDDISDICTTQSTA